MTFEELDADTRTWMLRRFEADESGQDPYRAKGLSAFGLREFPDLMRASFLAEDGNELALGVALSAPEFWSTERSYLRKGKTVTAKINPAAEAARLALTEFNTYYVAGLAHRLRAQGETHCDVYRAAEPKGAPASCSEHEGKRYLLTEIIAGHRAQYWPEPGDASAFAIPAGPNCHHSIRRCGSEW